MGNARTALLAWRKRRARAAEDSRGAGGELARRRRPKTAQLETVQPWNRARPLKHERPCGLVAPWPSDCPACFAVRPGALPRKRPAVRCGRADPYLRPARMAGDPTRAGSQSNRRRTRRRSRCLHSWPRSSGFCFRRLRSAPLREQALCRAQDTCASARQARQTILTQIRRGRRDVNRKRKPAVIWFERFGVPCAGSTPAGTALPCRPLPMESI